MSDTQVNPNELSDMVAGILDQYTAKVIDAAAEAVKVTAEQCVDKIQANIDKCNIGGTGEYRDSWIAELEEQTATGTVYRVHARAPYYRLTHLLEKGHLIVVHGTATGARSKKFPHIRPATTELSKRYGTNLQVGMRKR